MKIGLISDIHSNWEALEVVLDKLEAEEVDKIFSSGDVIGYGPDPNKCVNAFLENSIVSVKGNHDAGLVGKLGLDFFNNLGYEAINWTKDRITQSNMEFIGALPITKFFPDENICLLHGSSASPLTHYILRKMDAFRSFQARENDFSLQIYGHTHLPVVYEIHDDDVIEHRVFNPEEFQFDRGKTYLVNPGSVGQPRDGNWKSSFAILELTEKGLLDKVRFFREEYPVEETRQKIIDAGLPKRLGDRLLEGR